MRNYVIINGTNSLTIKGLAINIMPPISKPTMRTLREEIDGRDGDIVTELGYQAYDKMLEIGLYGSYDINEIIAFFNQKGTIVFSDEADKYYNFQILEKIDYTSLQKFRTATITIHCQPFKYPLNETPIEIQNEYLTGEGTNLTLQPTKQAPMQLDLKGNTSQDGTPTPSSPVDINVVSGDNTINICGKNLFNKSDVTDGKAIGQNGTLNNSSVSSVSDFIVCVSGNYTLNIGNNTINYTKRVVFFDENKNVLSYVETAQNLVNVYTFNVPTGTKYLRFQFPTAQKEEVQLEKGSSASTYEPYKGNTYPIYLGVENLFDIQGIVKGRLDNGVIGYASNTTDLTLNDNSFSFTTNANYRGVTSDYIKANQNLTFNSNTSRNSFGIQVACYDSNKTFIANATITNGSDETSKIITIANDTEYVRVYFYLSNAGTITIEKPQLGIGYISTTPIELCKIGTYQDYIYKDNGSWYLHKEIGKVVLDGSESWGVSNTGTANWFYKYLSQIPIINDSTLSNSMCDHYTFGSVGNSNTNTGYYVVKNNGEIRIRYGTEDTIANYKNWLASNNVICYYVLATPTNTEITDSTLISQLEETKESQNGTTNISQENNDMPFIISASALKEGSGEATITNGGNIYSKPTIELEGTGNVQIYLDGSQAFEVDMSEENNITIDTDKMEAYNPTDNTLSNRKVTGDYSKFKLNVGDNEMSIGGDITKATISNYTRWL